MSFIAGQVPTAAELNAEILTPFPQGIGAWASYTPTWATSGTAPSLGNGTLTGEWTKVARTILYSIRLVAGSTTTFGTLAWTFSLPETAAGGYFPCGWARLVDSSAGQQYGKMAFQNTTNVLAIVGDSASSFVANNAPFTWATNDQLIIAGSYQSAS